MNGRTILDWTARIIAWTAFAVGLGYGIWQHISADWVLTIRLTAVVVGWGIVMWALQRTFDIW